MADPLDQYRGKRDFGRTPEPGPGGGRRAPKPELPRFVVQEHSARRLHWDLRLEHDGVAASWALPRGVPEDPKRNHKAVHTEDHPLEYLEWEGDIPAGEYGAGRMRIWDRGRFEVEKWRADEVIAVFHGERMSGRYALFRAGEERDWMIHRMDPPLDAGREPLPEGLTPMLARPGPLPVDERGWAFEVKWDGVRALCAVEPGRLRLYSRNGREITASYPELRPLARVLGSRPALLDGEIVAFDEAGRPSFGRLQERMHVASDSAARRRAEALPVTLMLFDVLHLDGHSLMEHSYDERRARLLALQLAGSHWRTPEVYTADGAALLAATAEQGLEGVVAKRRDSPYEPGRRSGAWLKVKNVRRQELVVVGWVPGQGRRRERIGALLLAVHDRTGRLRYAGRVGTGFTERSLEELARRLAPLETERSPLEVLPSPPPPRNSVWVEPCLVAEIAFSEWTADGVVRHPSFKGLREDIDPHAVSQEDEGPRSVRDGARSVRGGLEVEIEGRTLKLTNWEKVLYPATGFSKGEAIDYYARVAEVLLPHLRDRPLTFRRFPNGVEGQSFYEKNCPRHRPDWLRTAHVADAGTSTDNCLIDDRAGIVWAANLAALELHPSLARLPSLEEPTVVAFDLDPGPPADVIACCRVALVLRGLFEAYGLHSAAKTSGSKGLQVYVPVAPGTTYDDTKGFARRVAELLAEQAPDLVVSRMTKSIRPGRVFVDWSQNDRHKTTVGVYSLRARERPSVSTPLRWEEVAAAEDAEALRFGPAEVLERVERDGDLFADALRREGRLPAG